MKNIILILVVLIIFGCDGNIDTSTYPLKQLDNEYEVDTWGTNVDIYEFTPEGNRDYFCVLGVSGVDELKAMFCMPKIKNEVDVSAQLPE